MNRRERRAVAKKQRDLGKSLDPEKVLFQRPAPNLTRGDGGHFGVNPNRGKV